MTQKVISVQNLESKKVQQGDTAKGASLGKATIRQDHLAPALQSARTVVRARAIHEEHVVVASTFVACPVDAESVGSAAYFGTIATAVHGAPAVNAIDGSSVRYLVIDIA